MAKVRFYIEKRKKEGKVIVKNVPILLNYSFNKQRLSYYTTERVDAKDWNSNAQQVKMSADRAEIINDNLTTLRLRVEKIHSNAKALNIAPTVQYFRDELSKLETDEGVTANSQDTAVAFTVFSGIKEYLTYIKVTKAANTFKGINATLNLFTVFLKSRNLTNYKDISQNLIEIFKNDLTVSRDTNWEIILDNEKQPKPRRNNTIVKNIDAIRNLLKWSKKKGYYSNSVEWSDLQLKANDTEVIFLTLDEIKHLMTLSLKPHLEAVRDVFVFSCFSGQRHEDYKKLRKVDVKDNFIQFHITKGGRTTSNIVPLVQQNREILAKYADLPGDKALPVISNQKMNKALKVIMQEAGFNDVVTLAHKLGDGSIIKTDYKKYELIGCHTSRKSFITNAIDRGMDEIVIKSLSGHSKNSRAFGRYYEVLDGRKQEEMNKAFSF